MMPVLDPPRVSCIEGTEHRTPNPAKYRLLHCEHVEGQTAHVALLHRWDGWFEVRYCHPGTATQAIIEDLETAGLYYEFYAEKAWTDAFRHTDLTDHNDMFSDHVVLTRDKPTLTHNDVYHDGGNCDGRTNH